MPNTPSSVRQNPAKKRKLTSTSTNVDIIDLTMPYRPNMSGSGDQLTNEEADVRSSQMNNKQAVSLDDEILNSEIYKIYCRNEDPKEAMKQIKELKTCLKFKEPTQPFPAEAEFRRMSEEVLETIWKLEPELKESKFVKIEKFVQQTDFVYYLPRINYNFHNNVRYCFTIITMLIPNGYEYWYVSNFEKGPGLSKWYRAESTREIEAENLAKLNVMGIKKVTIDKLQYIHYLKKYSEKTQWFDFAFKFLRYNLNTLYPFDGPLRTCLEFKFDVVEADTHNTNATMRLQKWDRDSRTWIIFKTYLGKSTRPFKKTRRTKNEKEIMEKEAKKAELREFFKEHFGFTECNDFCVDELQRATVI